MSFSADSCQYGSSSLTCGGLRTRGASWELLYCGNHKLTCWNDCPPLCSARTRKGLWLYISRAPDYENTRECVHFSITTPWNLAAEATFPDNPNCIDPQGEEMGDGRRHVSAHIQVGSSHRNQTGVGLSQSLGPLCHDLHPPEGFHPLSRSFGPNLRVETWGDWRMWFWKTPTLCWILQVALFSISDHPFQVFYPYSKNCLLLLDDNSNQSFMSDVYQPKMDNSSSNCSSQQVSPPHTFSLRAEDSQPPMLGQETVDGT